jgi:hypothetical protein
MQRQVFSGPARTNEEANRRNRLPVTPGDLKNSWKAQRAMLAHQLELNMQTGSDIFGNMVTEDSKRIKSWIAELDALIAEQSK